MKRLLGQTNSRSNQRLEQGPASPLLTPSTGPLSADDVGLPHGIRVHSDRTTETVYIMEEQRHWEHELGLLAKSSLPVTARAYR